MNVLITGVASGIGKAAKEYFINNGHIVYGIDINKVEEKENLLSFPCDITNENELLKIKEVLKIKNIELDLIINIAGIHKMASLVESKYSDIKKVIDINLLGTMLVNHTFHSLLKKDGRIIIVTSEVAAFDPLPFNGLYSISKIALDSYSQALRQELNLLGQKVITIRPGSIETPLSQGSLTGTEELAGSTYLFKKQSNKFLNIVKKFMGKPISPNKLAKLIYKASNKKNPKLTYNIHHNFGLVLLSILPKRLQCYIVKLLLK